MDYGMWMDWRLFSTHVQRCIQSSETPKFTTAKRKTSGKKSNSKMKTSVTVMFFFWPLWTLVSLMIEYIFEHYNLHLWRKRDRLIGKQLWNWRVANLDTLSIQMAKLNLLPWNTAYIAGLYYSRPAPIAHHEIPIPIPMLNNGSLN